MDVNEFKQTFAGKQVQLLNFSNPAVSKHPALLHKLQHDDGPTATLSQRITIDNLNLRATAYNLLSIKALGKVVQQRNLTVKQADAILFHA